MLVPKLYLCPEKFWVQINFYIKKILGPQILGPNSSFGFKKYLSSKQLLVQESIATSFKLRLARISAEQSLQDGQECGNNQTWNSSKS